MSIPELLVVVALLGMLAVIAIPGIQESVRFSRADGFAKQLGVSIRAVRMIAVSNQSVHALGATKVDGSVSDPQNPGNQAASPDEVRGFWYTDVHGALRRLHVPVQVEVLSWTAPDLAFRSNGALVAGAYELVLKRTDQPGAASDCGTTLDCWFVTVNNVGRTVVRHERGNA